MPATYLISQEHRTVFSFGTGLLTLEILNDHLNRLKVDPDFQPDFCQIVEMREIDTVQISIAQVDQFASRSLFSPSSRRAVVVGSELLFGLARMFATLRAMEGEPNIRVCRDLTEAAEWIGLPVETVRDELQHVKAILLETVETAA
jgi:hypothetical protein